MLAKRPDGFHEIASLFQAISLGDFLTVKPTSVQDELICTEPAIPKNSSNLILKAAELFRNKTGKREHFSFFLEKKIPIEAGLGGGSSNAATTLWALNQLLGTKIETSLLAKWGAEIGSDVPFFLSQGRAYVEGRGEQITPEPPFEMKLWVAKPKMGLSTQSVYQNVKIDKLIQREPRAVLASHRTVDPIFFNDLEESAFQLAPQLKEIRMALLNLGFEQVHMSGSGTAFFCLGLVHRPALPNIDFFHIQFLHRDQQSWYKLSQ